MRKIIALLAALCLVQQVSAGLTFMETPYDWLDQMIMPIWKPLVNLIVVSWAQNIVCGSYVDLMLDAIDATTTMTDDESSTFCKDGISNFMDSYFYGGTVDNKPNNFGWSWSPADDFTS